MLLEGPPNEPNLWCVSEYQRAQAAQEEPSYLGHFTPGSKGTLQCTYDNGFLRCTAHRTVYDAEVYQPATEEDQPCLKLLLQIIRDAARE